MDMCTHPHACSRMYAHVQYPGSVWPAGGGCRLWTPLTGGSSVQPPGFNPVPGEITGKVRQNPQLKGDTASGVRAGAGRGALGGQRTATEALRVSWSPRSAPYPFGSGKVESVIPPILQIACSLNVCLCWVEGGGQSRTHPSLSPGCLDVGGGEGLLSP